MTFAESQRQALSACRPVFGRGGGTTPPVLLGGGAFGLLLYPASVTPRGQRVWPPRYAARFEVKDGSLIELTRWGISNPVSEPDGSLGLRARPEGLSIDAARARRDALLSVYDQIRPAFDSGRSEDGALCAQALSLYENEVSPFLRPFLDPFGAAMLSWLRENAR